jgi:hypothetical protein
MEYYRMKIDPNKKLDPGVNIVGDKVIMADKDGREFKSMPLSTWHMLRFVGEGSEVPDSMEAWCGKEFDSETSNDD